MKPTFTRRTWGFLVGVMLVLALGLGIFVTYRVYPLWKLERTHRRESDALNAKTRRAQKVIASVDAIGRRSMETRSALARLSQVNAMGPVEEWFPQKIREHLSQHGIGQVEIRLESSVPDPENEEFKRTVWRVELPSQASVPDMNSVLLAVTAIEEKERYLRVLDCSFEVDPFDPEKSVGEFDIAAMMRE